MEQEENFFDELVMTKWVYSDDALLSSVPLDDFHTCRAADYFTNQRNYLPVVPDILDDRYETSQYDYLVGKCLSW